MAYIMDTNEEERAKVGGGAGAGSSVMRDRWRVWCGAVWCGSGMKLWAGGDGGSSLLP